MEHILNDIVQMYFKGYDIKEVIEGAIDLITVNNLRNMFNKFDMSEVSKVELYKGIQEARKMIDVAKNHLDYATNDDEINTAIAEMKAAELNYERLLRIAKKERNESIVITN